MMMDIRTGLKHKKTMKVIYDFLLEKFYLKFISTEGEELLLSNDF